MRGVNTGGSYWICHCSNFQGINLSLDGRWRLKLKWTPHSTISSVHNSFLSTFLGDFNEVGRGLQNIFPTVSLFHVKKCDIRDGCLRSCLPNTFTGKCRVFWNIQICYRNYEKTFEESEYKLEDKGNVVSARTQTPLAIFIRGKLLKWVSWNYILNCYNFTYYIYSSLMGLTFTAMFIPTW